jgi:hypothetical protein
MCKCVAPVSRPSSPAGFVQLQLRVPDWDGLVEQAGVGTSITTTVSPETSREASPLESPVSLASMSSAFDSAGDAIRLSTCAQADAMQPRMACSSPTPHGHCMLVLAKAGAVRAMCALFCSLTPLLGFAGRDARGLASSSGKKQRPRHGLPGGTEQLLESHGGEELHGVNVHAQQSRASADRAAPNNLSGQFERVRPIAWAEEQQEQQEASSSGASVALVPALGAIECWEPLIPAASPRAAEAAGPPVAVCSTGLVPSAGATLPTQMGDGAGVEGATLSSGDKWGTFEDSMQNKREQSRSPSTGSHGEEGPEEPTEAAGTGQSYEQEQALSKYRSLDDAAHIKSTTKISLQEIKKLLRRKWGHIKGEMEAGVHLLRACVTRCKVESLSLSLSPLSLRHSAAMLFNEPCQQCPVSQAFGSNALRHSAVSHRHSTLSLRHSAAMLFCIPSRLERVGCSSGLPLCNQVT